ncbi:hypothetical protein QAA20_004141 [Salmonella enterica]|nr:hypothetical protein [Salmonella enterica]EAB6033200.1 hypothetical protein [Salmonella enterica subsp. enterica serovar Java]EAW1265232.1 hypothetical protein [Salmonella enterica subsp. diarizonae]EBI0041259.1 hypothetical protein [Salmonella enterica subsp. diarizonae serovar 61:k:z35]ECT8549878.1 hypothetical protein [Salmonella enterica subsp. diarizonae serovar 48:i:z]EIC4422397.1 hypothetical protein [Salmonella enterica subsp. enterica serovar Cerro]
MSVIFPRLDDRKGHAWGLSETKPETVWERFSPAYEAQLERLIRVLENHGFKVSVDGAGSEDGEYVMACHDDGRQLFQHMEEPSEALRIFAMDYETLVRWLIKGLQGGNAR